MSLVFAVAIIAMAAPAPAQTDPPLSGDASLSELTLTETVSGNPIDLDPTFTPETLEYNAEVTTGVEVITLMADANHDGATLKYMNGKEGDLADADPDTAGFQIGLTLGTTVSKVQVEAENGTKRIYTASVFRPGPPLELSVDTIAGDDVVNMREKADGVAIAGNVHSEETGDMSGSSVSVVIGTESLSATPDSDGNWSIDIPPAAEYLSEPAVTVMMNATKAPFLPAPRVTRTLTVDLTPPALISATAQEDTLTLTFDERLAERAVSPDAFEVTLNGHTRPGMIATASGRNTVTLRLPVTLAAGDKVTLNYATPTGNNPRPIVDAAGNETAALTEYVVANRTPPGERCAGSDGSLRLVGGNETNVGANGPKEGRVEVCADDDTSDPTPARWGVVCDDYWTNQDADVVCKTLDYERSEPHAGRFRRSYFGSGSGPIWLDDLLCDGDEPSLLDCPVANGSRARDAIGEHNCKVTEVVGVRCMAAGDPLKPHVASQIDLTYPGESGRYEPGDILRVTVTFNEPVMVDSSGGTPTIGVYVGSGSDLASRSAPYENGSGTRRLEFRYRVVAEDGAFEELHVAADSLATHGGTIRNAAGLDAILAHGSAVAPVERFLQSPTLNVSDATTQEGAPLLFQVLLSDAAANDISVSYRTEAGTATEGTDFLPTSGILTIAPGQTELTVSVDTLDDAHDDGGETLTLALFNARGARISGGVATGTIMNSDPVPQAWLARFGRTAADHAVEAINARLRVSENVPGGMTIAAPAWLGDWSAWGRAATTRFDGTDGLVSLNGEVTTATLGIDSRRGRWLAGAAVAYNLGEGAYGHESAAGGVVTSTLASLHPYASFRFDERFSLWGVLGYGVGDLILLTDGAESSIETGLTSTMAAIGGRGVLRRSSGGFELAVVSDALLTNTVSESTVGLMGAEGGTQRLRLLLEGSGSFALPGNAELKPSVEAGLRYDTGDAENGTGVEVGGGLAYTAGRLSVQVDTRVLLAHQDKNYEEWGFSGSVRWQPNEYGHGWSASVGYSRGVTASGLDRMWSRSTMDGFAGGAPGDTVQRLEAELGYGLAAPKGRGLWYPFVGTRAADGGGQSVRMGVRLTSGANLDAELAIGRRAQPGGVADHAIHLRGALRW